MDMDIIIMIKEEQLSGFTELLEDEFEIDNNSQRTAFILI